MNIAICDDNKYWLKALRDGVVQWGEAIGVKAVCAMYASTRDLMEALSAKAGFDLLLLDIEFDSKTEGIDLSKRLRGIGCKTPLVFVSGHALMAAEGYYVDALGFLIKPFPYEKLVFFLDKAKKLRDSGIGRSLNIMTATMDARISVGEISYIECCGHDLLIHTDNGEYKVRQTIREILDELGTDGFIRIHKSYVVALRRIMGIKAAYPFIVELDIGNGARAKLRIGRTYFRQAQERFVNTITEMTI